MASRAQSFSGPPAKSNWFLDFLKEELRPYPGRGMLVTRMVIAATIVMILTMVFRLPYGAYAGVFALTISRENPRATINDAKTIILAFAASVAYVLCGTTLFLNDPTLRLFWVIGTLFIMFFALSTLTNYTAAARFGYLLIVTIPLWDEHTSASFRVENTLWAAGAIALGSLVTVLVELIFAELRPYDSLVQGISHRLLGTEQLLRDFAATGRAGEQAEKEIVQLALVGTSRLRRDLQRSSYSSLYREQMGAVVILVGRLVDIGANLMHVSQQISEQSRQHVQRLEENIAAIREDFVNGKIPRPVHPMGDATDLPLISEMEKLVSLITEVFTGRTYASAYAVPPSASGDPVRTFFVRDAWTNREHIKFALRGCLAASLCYIFYNAKDWPGISTSVTTCFLTALSTVGSSHQKQFLRLAGAFVGGVVFGIGSQVFVLPYLDTITGFTLLFLAISIVAAWFATSGSRLSYFGYQIAVAFYLVNLSDFSVQTSLYPARDRVLGIFLGLLMMWLAFDLLWGVSAADQMMRDFAYNLRLLARFTREPVSNDRAVLVKQGYSLREQINSRLDNVRAAADGVAVEFGSARERDLAWRAKIRKWQIDSRTYFVLRIALWKYRAHLEDFELPAPVLKALEKFDAQSADLLDAIADRFEDKTPAASPNLRPPVAELEAAIEDSRPEYQAAFPANLQTFLLLARNAQNVLTSMDLAIQPEVAHGNSPNPVPQTAR